MAEQGLMAFIDEQRAIVEEIERESALASWEASLTGTPQDESRAAELNARHLACFADADRYARLKALSAPAGTELDRQRTLLINSFAGNQMTRDVIEEISKRSMELETLFGNYRAELRRKLATENHIRDILRESPDAELRRDAWEASKSVGKLSGPKIRELVDIRNREARRLGYPDYYVMAIRLQELEEDSLFALLEDVAAQTKPLFTEFKKSLDEQLGRRFRVDPAAIRPWHYSDPFFQAAPEPEDVRMDQYFQGKSLEEITGRFLGAIGLDIWPVLKRSDLYEKPGKSQHAYCTRIGRVTGDVRVLCNIRSNSQWMQTMLHEFGHAAYDCEIDPALPFFLNDVAHIMTTEAIAQVMGRFSNSGVWLARWAGVPPEDAARIERAARAIHRAHMLIFTQWVLVMANFERALYSNPMQDLNRLWWDLVEKYQQVGRPENRDEPDWAAKIHLAASPAYYHNYLLGEMTAAQLLHTLRTQVVAGEDDLVSSPKVGEWLTENIFRHGARYSWNDLLTRATGELLNARYFVEDLETQPR